MEKTLVIDGKPILFKCTGGFLLRYRELVGQDPLRDIVKIQDLSKDGNLDVTDLTVDDLDTLYNIVWVMARTADPEIPSLVDWVDSFNEFPLADIFVDLIELFTFAFKSNLTMRGPKKKVVKTSR